MLKDQKTITPKEILVNYFGYSSFRNYQEEIINQLLSGRDSMVLMPTGGGKSICYQIPSLIRPGTGIVISPLIALMHDQVVSLRQIDIKADFLNSTLDSSEAMTVKERLISGESDLLYVSPERVMRPDFLEMLNQIQIALFAIDEAHCVSQWGHDFRPEYLKLSILEEHFPDVPRIALTATADSITRKEILEKLKLSNAAVYISSFDRPNIRYRVGLKENIRTQLKNFLIREHSANSGIVYCMSRKKVESTAEWLSSEGYNAFPYHAGLKKSIRTENQRRFLTEDKVIIVATIAFGMGINKPDVRFVAHLDLPSSLECYYQETGRAGRDGEKADAWMVYSLGDVVALRNLMENSQGDEQYKRIQNQRLNALLGYCETAQCRRQVLLNYFGENLAEPCGNCDTCLDPLETWNGSVAAQKALSCIFRTGQMFGAGYLIDVLLGKQNERIARFGHDKASTFGIGKELSSQEWKSVYRQLIAAGMIKIDMDRKGGFRLANESRPILKGEQKIFFRRDPIPIKHRPQKRSQKVQSETITLPLFDELRKLRLQIARDSELPPYMIFHDSTLIDMINQMPTTQEEMSLVSGIGRKKLERYGKQFLDILIQHSKNNESGQLSPGVLSPE